MLKKRGVGAQAETGDAAAAALAQREAVLKFVSSEGRLKCGRGYSEGLKLVAKVPSAEVAYAMADVLGGSIDSKFVEDYADWHCKERGLDVVGDRSKGYAAFVNEVIDVAVNNQSPKDPWLVAAQKKKAEIAQLLDEKGGCRMLKFARAISALWKEEAPSSTDETFDNSQQSPADYVLSGQRTKGYVSTVFPHAVECATTKDDFEKISFTLRGYGSGKYANLMPALQARARQVGYTGQI
jgi:hypothetical protein